MERAANEFNEMIGKMTKSPVSQGRGSQKTTTIGNGIYSEMVSQMLNRSNFES